MVKKDLELKVYVSGPIHAAFKELAEECMKQGVQINEVKFNWFENTSITTKKYNNTLTKVRIDSEYS